MPENTTPLTDGQRDLAAGHVPLARWAAWRFPRLVRQLGEQEAVSLACLALCRCARAFDPARGGFSTIAVVYVRQQLCHAAERARRKKRGGGRRPLPLDESDAPGVRDPEPAEPEPWLPAALARLDATDRLILRLWAGFDGEPMAEVAIGVRLGMTRSAVSQRRKRALRELRGMAPRGA
jgi:RNA polymerase sigma factor (sigma-70 family)